MIYYALLPCTVVLEFDMGQPDGVLLRSRACYAEQATVIEQQTGQTEHSWISLHMPPYTSSLWPADWDAVKVHRIGAVAEPLKM